ncbi:MAG: hypothetical protein HYZ75_16265 [Elusimicrobia bacterium]|nr:hypothetical protein [Elusimicrobiota bacterium]
MAAGSAQVVLTFSGDTPEARAAALRRAADLSGGSQDVDVAEAGHKVRLRLIVTGAASPQSFESAVRYAVGEVRDGIGEAGGSLGDGVHAQLQWLRAP